MEIRLDKLGLNIADPQPKKKKPIQRENVKVALPINIKPAISDKAANCMSFFSPRRLVNLPIKLT